MIRKLFAVILAGSLLTTPGLASAKIAGGQLLYDGHQTPDGVTVGMDASVLRDIYGPADWEGSNPSLRSWERHTYLYHYFSDDKPTKMLEFGVSKYNNKICWISVLDRNFVE